MKFDLFYVKILISIFSNFKNLISIHILYRYCIYINIYIYIKYIVYINLQSATQKSIQFKNIMPPEMYDSEKIIWEGLNYQVKQTQSLQQTSNLG